MTDLSYEVAPKDDDRWGIGFKGHMVGDYPSEGEAVEAAEKLAREARGCGYDARLVVRDRFGRVAEVKTFAADAA